MSLSIIGSGCFGFVIGWITYRTLRRNSEAVALSDIATVLGAIGGAGVMTLFKKEDLFAAYSIGLLIGFIGYLIVGLIAGGKKDLDGWLSDD